MLRIVRNFIINLSVLLVPGVVFAQLMPCPTTAQQLFWETGPEPPPSTNYFIVVRWNVVFMGGRPQLVLSRSGNTVHVTLSSGGSIGVPPPPTSYTVVSVLGDVPAGTYTVQVDPFPTSSISPILTTCPAPFPIPMVVPAGTVATEVPVDATSRLGLMLLIALVAIVGIFRRYPNKFV